MADLADTFTRTRRNAQRGGFDTVRNLWGTLGTTQSPTYQAQPEGTFGPSRAINAVLGDALLMALSGASGVAAGGAGAVADTADALGMRPDNADRLGRDLAAMAVEAPWNELAAFAPTLTAGGANAAVRGGRAASNFVGDEAGTLPIPGMGSNGGPPLDPPRARRRGLFYSQAEQALLANPQSKGTVQQFVAQMQKAGVKPDELVWSGFNRQFPDPNQKVTREELAQFFREAPEPITRRTLQASGRTGEPGFDEVSAYSNFWESESYDGTLRSDIEDEMVNTILEEGTTLGDLRETNPQTYARLAAEYDEADLDDDFIFYDGEIVRDPDSYVRDFMSSEVDNEFDRRVGEAWEDWGRESEREALRDAGFFEPGSTQYAQNFTPGALNYREDLFHVDPENRNRAFGSYGPQDIYEAPHFAGNATDLAFHTRAGEFTTPDGNASVYHLGEIQSDYGQKNRGRIRSPEDEARLENLLTDAYAKDFEANAIDENMAEILGARPGAMNSAGVLTRDPDSLRRMMENPEVSRYNQQEILERYARVAPGFEASPLQFNRGNYDHAFDVAPLSWSPSVESTHGVRRNRVWWGEANKQPRVQLSFADLPDQDLVGLENLNFLVDQVPEWPPSRTNNFNEAELNLVPSEARPMVAGNNHSDYVPEMARRQSAYRGTAEEPALPLGYTPAQEQLADLFDARGTLRAEAEAAQTAYDDAKRGTVPAAPFVTTTDKFTDQALKRAFAEALEGMPEEGSQFDFFTLGNPEMAQRMTYMPVDASEKFYGKLVPARMQKLLDQVAPGHKVEQIEIDTPEGIQQVYGVRLTDELREAAEKNGIPLYSVGGGLVVLGTAAGLPGEGEARRPDA